MVFIFSYVPFLGLDSLLVSPQFPFLGPTWYKQGLSAWFLRDNFHSQERTERCKHLELRLIKTLIIIHDSSALEHNTAVLWSLGQLTWSIALNFGLWLLQWLKIVYTFQEISIPTNNINCHIGNNLTSPKLYFGEWSKILASAFSGQ